MKNLKRKALIVLYIVVGAILFITMEQTARANAAPSDVSNYVNVIRNDAGKPSLATDKALNSRAQSLASGFAASGKLTSLPAQPSSIMSKFSNTSQAASFSSGSPSDAMDSMGRTQGAVLKKSGVDALGVGQSSKAGKHYVVVIVGQHRAAQRAAAPPPTKSKAKGTTAPKKTVTKPKGSSSAKKGDGASSSSAAASRKAQEAEKARRAAEAKAKELEQAKKDADAKAAEKLKAEHAKAEQERKAAEKAKADAVKKAQEDAEKERKQQARDTAEQRKQEAKKHQEALDAASQRTEKVQSIITKTIRYTGVSAFGLSLGLLGVAGWFRSRRKPLQPLPAANLDEFLGVEETESTGSLGNKRTYTLAQAVADLEAEQVKLEKVEAEIFPSVP